MSTKGNGFLHFLNIIGKLIDDKAIYVNIQNDPELKKYSKHFGGHAILYSIFFALLAIGGTFLMYTGFTRNIGVILNIFAIMLGIGLVIPSFELFIFAFSSTIKQLRINRRFISWLALFIFIVCVGLTAVTIFAMTGSLAKA